MKDPKEKNNQEEDLNTEQENDRNSAQAENSNWSEHQQVDEEGNEVAPEDIN